MNTCTVPPYLIVQGVPPPTYESFLTKPWADNFFVIFFVSSLRLDAFLIFPSVSIHVIYTCLSIHVRDSTPRKE